MINLNELITIAIDASLKAGKEILSVYESEDFHVESKDDNSPVTLADRNAHNVISDCLKVTNIPVLSEEGVHLSYEKRKKWDIFWLVDPLDGTKEFIKRNNEFTVNIALVKGNTPIAGVIYVPFTGALYFAEINTGAYKIENIHSLILQEYSFDALKSKALKLPLSNIERPFTVVGSRSHLYDETIKYIDNLKIKHPDLKMLLVGSSLKQCIIAEGTADIYPRFGPTMEWDTAAAQAIILASGASITQIDGSPMIYNKENLLNPNFIVKRKQ